MKIPTVVAAVAIGLLAAGVSPYGSRAGALPPTCPGGEPPPCESDDPPPDDPPPDDPPPDPTTGWSSLISVLDQSEDGYETNVLGAWVSTGSPVYTTHAETVHWSNADHNQGTIRIPHPNISVAPLLGFQLWEQDQAIDGPLCRSTPIPNVPLILTSTHVLVAGSDTTTQGDLDQLAAGFVGTVSIPESESGTYSATVQLHEVTLELGTGTLPLTINGHLFVDGPGPFNVDGDFEYTGQVHLGPSRKAEVDQIVTATTSDDTLDISGEDADREAEILPAFRRAIAKKVSGAVNAKVAASPEAQFFTSLGFTVSFRDISIDGAGLHVLPSLCKVD